MKKIFKVLSIIVVLVMVAIGLFLGWSFLSEHLHEKKLDKERINDSTTLSKYVKYHDVEHTRDFETELNFYAKDIKCDLLNDKNILYFQDDGWDNGILVLDDYTIYETAFKSDKLYSNGQQCKQIETDIKIKQVKVLFNSPYFISEDNKYYKIENKELKELSTNYMSSYEYIYTTALLKDNSIKKVISRNVDNMVVVIKDDGQIYKQEYNYDYINDTYSLINETLLLSNKEYGNIIDCVYERWQYEPDGTKQEITTIVSDKGLYYLKQTNEQQYIDTEPTKEMVLSDIYNKYKSDVKYINSDYIFTTDNSIIATKMLCRDIDKEVK